MSRTILIMAGGTGGHIFPALSVADRLRGEGWNVVWLGSRRGMEAALVAARGYTMAWVRMSGLRGKGLLRAALLPLDLLIAFAQAARAIFRHRPDVVLGMGGYVAFPGGMMASLLNRPLVLHEQNAIAGLTNRVLAHLADRVLTGFPGAFADATRAEWVGNPVRGDIAGLAEPQTRMTGRTSRLKLLVVGGSQGARALNTVVPEALARLPAATRPHVTHQAGAAGREALEARYRHFEVEAEVLAFIDDMAVRYAAADLVVCRAGASTIAEIAAAGIASVLVPYPHAVDDHQTANARFLVERGAAVLMPETEFTAEALARFLTAASREQLTGMARAAREAAKPDAAGAVANVCIELAHAA